MARAGTARLQDVGFFSRRTLKMPYVLRWLRRPSLDSVAGAVAAFAATAILVNALFMQSGPHPAPIFANKPAPVPVSMQPAVSANGVIPRPRPADAQVTVAPNARARFDVVADIQRELARHGFYDGAADGVYGPRTDSAIRDFEQAAGLRPAAEPNDVLLTTIKRSTVNATPVPASRSDPIAALLAPNARIVAVQRALTDFGYGPVKPTGLYDPETQSAIERFERARRRPMTGRITEQLVRDLAAMTGRPLE
jgi:peptidoglycan hydrolase-like protein with peptidoglycan-binding domain